MDPSSLTYTILSDGYAEILSSYETLDGQTITFTVLVESDINPTDTGSQSFDFKVTYEDVPCSPDLTVSPVTIQSQYLYEIGSGPLTITLDEVHNGSCFFAVSLIDLANLSDVSISPPFSLAQPELVQNDLYRPNDFSIVA